MDQTPSAENSGCRCRPKSMDVREYASTLVGAVIGSDSAIFYQVGDGGIVFSSEGSAGEFDFGIEPEDTEYVNMTDFITDELALECLKYKRVDGVIEDLILFSDGVFPIAVDYRENRPHHPFLKPMIAPLRESTDPNGLERETRDVFVIPRNKYED